MKVFAHITVVNFSARSVPDSAADASRRPRRCQATRSQGRPLVLRGEWPRRLLLRPGPAAAASRRRTATRRHLLPGRQEHGPAERLRQLLASSSSISCSLPMSVCSSPSLEASSCSWPNSDKSLTSGVILKDFSPEGSCAHRPNRCQRAYPPRARSFASSGCPQEKTIQTEPLLSS